MSMRMQVVLLRFLETGEIQRIGADRSHTRVNARLITATNRDLQEQITAGAFRDDLYFRLNVIRICVPPLRERLEDIPVLVEHFLDICSRQHRVSRPSITAAAMDVLVEHRWPGNIRELRNLVERLVLKAGDRPIEPGDLPTDVVRATAPQRAPEAAARPSRASIANDLATRMLEHRESFWSIVYPGFMSRDLTREDLRKIIRVGLERTNGNYRLLTRLFGMADEDYKRFLSFLRKHECHQPFQAFRAAAGTHGQANAAPRSSAGHNAA
jgi:DNA-binding NtrC family response regulator